MVSLQGTFTMASSKMSDLMATGTQRVSAVMNLNKVRNNFDRLFDKNLSDLVRGIRNNKSNETKFIAQCIEEIKEELKIPNVNVKANAVAKLTYLQMLGYDIGWAAFNIIEVMSSERFTHKRIGYLAASQCFTSNTEVLMLTINMIRRDLCARNIYETGCALSGLSCFVSSEIGRELFNDVHRLLTSTKPYLRKKAVLLMYKIVIVFPETLPEVLPKLEEKLEDPDQGVQSSVINVICELARRSPKEFVHLESTLYKLMENSSNNWMLIKIIKLFGSLTPLEPKIGEKIIQPLENLAHSTSAMSVLYETVSTIMAILTSPTSRVPKQRASAYRQLCVQKLRLFIEDSDQNLKYLGLLAMKKMLQIHPKSVRAHQDIILTCLEDKDESIRLRALDLLYGMVSKDNLTTSTGDGIIDRLMKHVSYPEMGNKFRDEIVLKVIDICSRNDYLYVSNFDWYITVLVTLASMEGGTSHGDVIAQQLLDVAVRVKEVRPYAVKQMATILKHIDKFSTNFSVTEVLYAASWICGEYSEYLTDKQNTMYDLLRTSNFTPYIIAIFVQNACKIFSRLSQEISEEKLLPICDRLLTQDLPKAALIEDLEVQFRVANFSNIIRLTKEEGIDFSKMFYAYSLNPVSVQAQSKVPIPAGLDLDEQIIEDDSQDLEDETLEDKIDGKFENEYENDVQIDRYDDSHDDQPSYQQPSTDERTGLYQSNKNDIHYLKRSNDIEQAVEAVDFLSNTSPSSSDLARAPEKSSISQGATSIPGLLFYNDFNRCEAKTNPTRAVKAKVSKKISKTPTVKIADETQEGTASSSTKKSIKKRKKKVAEKQTDTVQ